MLNPAKGKILLICEEKEKFLSFPSVWAFAEDHTFLSQNLTPSSCEEFLLFTVLPFVPFVPAPRHLIAFSSVELL